MLRKLRMCNQEYESSELFTSYQYWFVERLSQGQRDLPADNEFSAHSPTRREALSSLGESFTLDWWRKYFNLVVFGLAKNREKIVVNTRAAEIFASAILILEKGIWWGMIELASSMRRHNSVEYLLFPNQTLYFSDYVSTYFLVLDRL